MVKWLPEIVLQRYFVERHSKYSVRGHNIVSSRFNQPLDRYPDVSITLDDKVKVPVEIEWKTSDFDHDIDVLRKAGGCIAVYQKDQAFELDQLEIDKEDFKNWYISNAASIFADSVKELQE